jgi:hypothetical protein
VRTRVKVCGITRTEDALAAAQAGADAIGLVFYPPSPRFLSVERARAIREALPPFVQSVALFVNADAAQVAQVIGRVHPAMLQFHGDLPDARGHFGPYGGVFVAETLMHALEELRTRPTSATRNDPEFVAEFEHELKHYVGRPSPVYHAKRWSERTRAARRSTQARGPQPHRRAQDQQHHRPGAARRRMGKPRVIAETGAGQHGVATATVAARYGMECVVYMGAEDVGARRRTSTA